MTREEFKKIAVGMKHLYAQETFMPTQEAFELWYSFFKDDEYMTVQNAVKKHVATNPRIPTVADIRAQMTTEGMTEEEAWQTVLKAVQNSNYNAQAEFENLPEVLQEAVVSPSHLAVMASMDRGELHTVEKSHFIRTFRTVSERAKKTEAIPEKMRDLIAQSMPKIAG